jgi:hypothetical protein
MPVPKAIVHADPGVNCTTPHGVAHLGVDPGFEPGLEGHGIGIPLVPMINRMAAKAAPTRYDKRKRRLEGRHQHPPGQVQDQGRAVT